MSDTTQTADELLKVQGGYLTADRTINVTQDAIDHGHKRDQWGCAIVKAIQSQYPTATRVRVNAKFIGFSMNDVRYTYPTPPEAVEGIIKPFDKGGQAEPMRLKLRGGKMRDVVHADERVKITKRNYNRAMAKAERTDREKQMSPNYHENERF